MPGTVSGLSVSPFSRAGGLGAGAIVFEQQEPVGQQDHRRVVVEPAPAPPLEVIQAQLFLHPLVPRSTRHRCFRRRTAATRDVLGGGFDSAYWTRPSSLASTSSYSGLKFPTVR